jgi:hypothetical protein
VALKQEESRAGSEPPVLYAGYTLGDEAVFFRPVTPSGTESVMYSFDDGGLLPAEPASTRGRATRAWTFRGNPQGRHVRLEIRMAGGAVHGPFVYHAEEAAALPVNTMKASLLADQHTLVRCFVVSETFTERSLTADRSSSNAEARRNAARLTSVLRSNGLEFVTRGPATACRPNWETRTSARGYHGDWGAVEELHFGTAPGRLRTNVRNTLTPADVMANRVPRGGAELARMWNVVLPAGAEGVYVQLSFRDGTQSAETRVILERLPQQ